MDSKMQYDSFFTDSMQYFDDSVLNDPELNTAKETNTNLTVDKKRKIDTNKKILNESMCDLDDLACTSLAEKSLLSESINFSKTQLKISNCSLSNLFKDDSILFDSSFDNIATKSLQSKMRRCENESTCESNTNNTFYGLPLQVKLLIQKFKGINELYEWQDECLKLKAIKDRRNLIYALPTSGGKTLVAELLMLKEIICNKKNVIFILPYVAIVQEKIQSLAPFALELGFLIEEYAGGKGAYPPKKRRRKNSIYICTIEKSLGLTNSLIETGRFDEIGLVVVDELHLVGEPGGRGATLEGLLTKIMYVNDKVHIVGMSATIGNVQEIAAFLHAELYTRNFRPIEIREYVKCENDIFLVDSRQEEMFVDKKRVNYKYSDVISKLDPDRIGGLVMDVAPQDSCLIFCSSRKNCENVAILLSKVLPRKMEEHLKKEKQNLLSSLKTEGELCPILAKTIRVGVAYHHSGLTSEERKLLEDAFKNNTLCVICCTSTLAAGVNLPARRVILRTPYVGNQFLTMSRYKQMIGRAGRAGMKSVGESILVTTASDIPKVKEMLKSQMNDCLSTLHVETDRGLNNLILSSILLSIASTRFDLHKLVSYTLLSIQEKKLNVCIKNIVDDAITNLLKDGIIKTNRNKDNTRKNVSVVYPSQVNVNKIAEEDTDNKIKCVVNVTYETELTLCDIGRAAMKGCIDIESAFILYEDLKTAQKKLNLVDHLHLLYLVTPYEYINQIKPVGTVYYDVITKLSQEQMEVVKLIGLNEGMMCKIREGIMPKNIQLRIVNRFYVTLMLYELWNQDTVYHVAEKYQTSRGVIQNLLSSTASFASSAVRFCEEFKEFWAFKELLSTFSQKIMYCCACELEPLMELPSVKIGRARQLYSAGYRTLQSIAKATPKEIQSKVKHIPNSVLKQIIATANLLILEKVENLRDEAQDVLDGIDLKDFI